MKTIIDLRNSLSSLNKEYKSDNKYSIVSTALKNAEQIAHELNVQAHNDTFESCGTFESFFKACKFVDTTITLSKDNTFETSERDTIVSLTAYVAYRNLHHTKDGKGNILPENFRQNVKVALATLAAAVAVTTEGIDTTAELVRICKAYKVTIEQPSKKWARTLLFKLANDLVPGTKISGSDLTKVMLGVFTVNPLTWKIKLPREETLYRVFTAMMHSIITRGEVVDSIFEDIDE